MASAKKAEDILILDMRKAVNFCDYFVICSGTSDRHVNALAQHIEEGFENPLRLKEGIKEGKWAILDIGDVVVHIFEKGMREFYKLEYLWQEAPRVKWQ